MDFGRPFDFAGAGEEDPVLEKGLPRFCGDEEDMMMRSVCKDQHGRYFEEKQIQAPRIIWACVKRVWVL